MHKPGTSETIRLTVPAPTHYGEAVCVVAKGEPLEVDLLAESVHEGILVSGTVTTRATAECVRCLDPIEVAIEAPLQELFAYLADEAYDYLVVQESIDLDQVVRDQVVVELPFQPVCQDDCPGLDPATGIKRETGSAQANTTRTDPRWAKLHDVFPGTSTEGDPGSPPQS
jgi:uncharacterized protein